MAKNDNSKSKAELYREERKERIAKANKKNAKSIEKGKAAAGVARKVIAIVLCCAIVIGAGFYVCKTTGVARKIVTAVKVGDIKVSAVDYNYYYNNMYQQMVYYAEMYSQYGMDMGYDTTIAPDEQTTTDDDGNEITWAKYFEDSACDRAQFIEAYYNEAIAAGYELDDDQKSEIDETVQSYSDSASENNYSLSAYLKAAFGAGYSEKKFRAQLEKEEIASGYYEKLQEDYDASISDEDIQSEYDANKKDYDYVDVTYYVFSGTTLTANDGESDEDLAKRQEKQNKEFFADVKAISEKVTDDDSLEKAVKTYKEAEDDDDTTYTTSSEHTSYESIKSAMDEEVAEWAYKSSTKSGTVGYFENENDAYIVILDKASYTSHSVDVRQCLVGFDAEDEDNVTDEEKATAKEKAEKLLAEWKEGDATEATFITMANENTTDTATSETGGLYSGVRITDSYVDEFLDWCFDSSRKAGDVGIIETTYGYHIMYFVSDNKDDLDWKATIRDTKGGEAFEAYDAELLGDEGNYVVTANETVTSYISKDFCKKIAKNLAYSSSSES